MRELSQIEAGGCRCKAHGDSQFRHRGWRGITGLRVIMINQSDLSDAVRNGFRLQEAPGLIVSALNDAQISIVEVISRETDHCLSGSLPTQDAFLVNQNLSGFLACDVWQSGRHDNGHRGGSDHHRRSQTGSPDRHDQAVPCAILSDPYRRTVRDRRGSLRATDPRIALRSRVRISGRGAEPPRQRGSGRPAAA